MSKLKIKCNKCGTIIYLQNNDINIICKNCGNTINKKVSKINNHESVERLIYLVENKILINEDYSFELAKLNELNVNNDLINYLNHKNNIEDLNLELKNDEFKYYIIKDIINDDKLNINQKNEILKKLRLIDKELIFSDTDNDFEDLFKEKINIVQSETKKKYDFFYIKLGLSVLLALIIFIIGLIIDKDYAKNTVIILSILPSILISEAVINKFKFKVIAKAILMLILVLIIYFILSYIESLKFNGIISLAEHCHNIIYAIPDLINTIQEKAEFIADLGEN